MLEQLRSRAQDQKGFSLVELLVVILIISILAAIAIPAFLNQRGKAYDAAAKWNIKTAQSAEEIYSTDNSGAHATDTLSASDTGPLAALEPALKNPPYVTATANGATGYTLVATAEGTGTVFTLFSSNGRVTRTCTVRSGSPDPSGCIGGTW